MEAILAITKYTKMKFVLIAISKRSPNSPLHYKEGAEEVESSEELKQVTTCVFRI